MKTYKFFAIAMAAVATASCAKEIAQTNAPEENLNLSPLTLSACTGEEDTKAGFSGTAYPVIEWKANDAISILGTATGNQKFTTTAAGASVEFSGLADLTDETLYAVYPYNADITLNDDGTLAGVRIPEIQTATAGSFDPKAYVAVAECTDKNTLSFKNLGAFLKFQVADAANVESVTFIGNNSENLACTADKVNVTTVSHSGPKNSNVYVRVQGTFEAEKDYFAIIRPNSFANGITVCVKYKDNTIKYCMSASKVFNNGNRNRIKNLGILNPTKDISEDLYACYVMGKNIKIGNTSFIKSEEGAPTPSLLTANGDEDVDVYSTINGTQKNKIVFLTQEGDRQFILSQTANLTDRVLLVSRYADKKTSIVCSDGVKILAKSGSLYFKNVNITCSNTVTYLIYNYNQATTVDAIVFDGCKITNIDMNLLELSGSGVVSNIEIMNSDLVFNATPSNTNAGAAIIKSNQSITYPSITIEQCLLYCENDNDRQVAFFSNSNTNRNASINAFSFVRNTVAGLYPTSNYSYIMVNKLDNYTIKNNYFHLPEYSTESYASTTKYLSIVKADTNPVTYSIARDYLWYDGTKGTSKALKAFSTDLSNDTTVYYPYMKSAEADNAMTIDWNNGTFVSSNNSYGAQRTLTGTQALSERQTWNGVSAWN